MISGRTQLCAILADPIAHVRTPETFNALMTARGHDAVLVPMHVSTDALPTAVAALKAIANLAGFVVTVPHKIAMVPLCDELSGAAQIAGAVNIVRRTAEGRLHGHILDGDGFVAGLRQSGVEPAGRSVYIAGAGGAANAIAFALAAAGVSRIGIWNRTRAKAETLANRLRVAGYGCDMAVEGADPAGYQIVVNATSLGLRETDPLPLAADQLTSDQIVAEIIMKPEWTPLLLEAKARGCTVALGAPMLDCQLPMMADYLGLTA